MVRAGVNVAEVVAGMIGLIEMLFVVVLLLLVTVCSVVWLNEL
jgi:hypothetical protein